MARKRKRLKSLHCIIATGPIKEIAYSDDSEHRVTRNRTLEIFSSVIKNVKSVKLLSKYQKEAERVYLRHPVLGGDMCFRDRWKKLLSDRIEQIVKSDWELKIGDPAQDPDLIELTRAAPVPSDQMAQIIRCLELASQVRELG